MKLVLALYICYVMYVTIRQRGFCDGVSTCVNVANKIIFGSGTRLITQTSKLMLSMLMLYWNYIPNILN